MKNFEIKLPDKKKAKKYRYCLRDGNLVFFFNKIPKNAICFGTDDEQDAINFFLDAHNSDVKDEGFYIKRLKH